MIIKIHWVSDLLILTDSRSDFVNDMLLWSVFACSACPNLVHFLSVTTVPATLTCFVLFIYLASQTVRFTIHSFVHLQYLESLAVVVLWERLVCLKQMDNSRLLAKALATLVPHSRSHGRQGNRNRQCKRRSVPERKWHTTGSGMCQRHEELEEICPCSQWRSGKFRTGRTLGSPLPISLPFLPFPYPPFPLLPPPSHLPFLLSPNLSSLFLLLSLPSCPSFFPSLRSGSG